MRRRNSDRGQLSLGLAFGFMAVLAMFSLVLHSSFVTREKMQMQQTTDFAALVAATVQQRNLNRIREINDTIERGYSYTQGVLMPLSGLSPCQLTVGLPNLYSVVQTSAAPIIGTNPAQMIRVDKAANDAGEKATQEANSIAATQAPDTSQPSPCDVICSKVDAAYRNNLIMAYGVLRTEAMKEIIAIIEGANERAYDYALNTFLTPTNFPAGAQGILKDRYGGGVTLEALRSEYEKGALKGLFEVNDSNKSVPLFIPKQEIRTFQYLRFNYPTWYGTVIGDTRCDPPSHNFIPRFSVSVAKVARTTNFTTSFLAGATYYPEQNPAIKKLALYLRDPQSTRTDSVLRDLQGNAIRLIQERSAMTTMALAKPFGGTFPRAGNPFNPTDHGDLGTEFKGAKLIGIADRNEVEGYDLGIGGRIERKDSSGKVLDSTEVFQEDFLH